MATLVDTACMERTFLRDNTVSLRAIQLVRDNAIRARGSVVPFVFLFSLSLSLPFLFVPPREKESSVSAMAVIENPLFAPPGRNAIQLLRRQGSFSRSTSFKPRNAQGGN